VLGSEALQAGGGEELSRDGLARGRTYEVADVALLPGDDAQPAIRWIGADYTARLYAHIHQLL
jgi:hypothetical protein